MKIAFTTVDLYKGREFLMPWRTVIEVVRGMRGRGIDADVVTVPVSGAQEGYEFNGVEIKTAPRDFVEFSKFVDRNGYDVVIYPTPWREALKGSFKAFGAIKARKIAYFPGGVYSWRNNLALWRWGGLNIAKPYMIDTLTPYGHFVKVMKNCGFEAVVGLSPYTAETVKKAGFEKSVCILPGKDGFERLEEDLDVFERLGLRKEEKYLLFTGAPAATRGSQVLAKACGLLKEDVKVVFLMRKDVGSDFTEFQKAFNRIPKTTNVQLITERVNRNELKTLMAHARGVILPFLVAPSEIPITYFEVLSVGTPIVTFRNNGTTEYMKDALLMCRAGDVSGLAKNLEKMWRDDQLHDKLRENGLRIMADHPDWNEVTEQWINLIKG